MAILDTLTPSACGVVALAILASSLVYLLQKPSLPANAPPLDPNASPVLGSWSFFTSRWDWINHTSHRSRTGNFSFYAGQWPVVSVAGEAGRKFFFEEKRLGFAEGYATLLGGGSAPSTSDSGLEGPQADQATFNGYFNKRIVSVVRPSRLAGNLPRILRDAREMFDRLAAGPGTRTDVFESVFRMIFKFTMRTVACNEIADDPKLLERTMLLFEQLDTTATPVSIAFPWVPTPAKLRRLYIGAQLYKIVNDVVKTRLKSGRKDDDPLQYLLDEGDKPVDILTFILGALFAGQLNSGINTSYVLLHLATSPTWLDRVKEEVNTVAIKHAPDPSLSLADRLMQVPLEAWENDFPTTDLCLRETIRLYTVGTTFRKNTSGHDIPISKQGSEIVPKDAFVTYAVGEVHYNPAIYAEPDLWDPSRYLPDRAEDKKQTHAYVGWGAARHPCLGMRFAKIENNVVVAFMLAYFENLRVVDRSGRKVDEIPAADRNRPSAHKPKERVFLAYDLKDEKGSAAA